MDKELRERAKHALEVAGKATFISLDSAVKSIEGVDSILIEEMPDGIAGVVKIIVDGGELEEIERVINETRAAGIRVELSRPKPVYIDAMLTITLKRSASVEREVEAKVRSYISSLGIGEDVIYSRMVGAVLEVDEVYDVSELIIKAYRRDGEEIITSTRENIRINSEERAVPRTVNILIKTLEKRVK